MLTTVFLHLQIYNIVLIEVCFYTINLQFFIRIFALLPVKCQKKKTHRCFLELNIPQGEINDMELLFLNDQVSNIQIYSVDY